MKKPFSSRDLDGISPAIEQIRQRWLAIQDHQELASSISHDLVQPLSEIVNRVWLSRDSCKRVEETSQLHESLDQIENCAIRAAELVRLAHQLIGAKFCNESQRDFGEPGDTVS